MKKLWKYAGVMAMLALLFGFTACSSDDGDSENTAGGSQETGTKEEDVVLKVNEDDTENGYVSVSGTNARASADSNFTYEEEDGTLDSYDGKYLEYLGSDAVITYSINSPSAQTVSVLLHYGFWGGSGKTVRGAYVVVNGKQNSEPIYLNYTSGNRKANKKANLNVKEFEADGVTPKTYYPIWEDSNAVSVSLDAGENQIRIIPVPAGTSMPNARYQVAPKDNAGVYTAPDRKEGNYTAEGSLANIDYLKVTGKGLSAGKNQLAFYTVNVSSENDNYGSVTVSPAQDYYKTGTTVTITAEPKSGYKFDAWLGTESYSTASKEITVTNDYTLKARFILSNAEIPAGLYGYAAITDDNGTAYTITGGAGGEIIEIASLEDLTTNETKLSRDEPYIVKFTSGTRITTSDNLSIICNIGSNKTIYGAVEGAGLKNIEMRVSGSNVIIRNMIFGEVISYDNLDGYKGLGNDALALNGAKHVWVDHCEFRSNLEPKDNSGNSVSNSSDADFKKDWYDGLLDLKNQASWITVSNCYFHDHWKAFLCGSNDTDSSEKVMRLTIYKCYFYNINSRQPLFRFGKAHIVNNYFYAPEDNSDIYHRANCIDVRAESQVWAEGNYFKGVKNPIGQNLGGSGGTAGTFYFADSNTQDDCSNTVTEGSTGNTLGESGKPKYSLTVDAASTDIATTAGANLGSTLSY